MPRKARFVLLAEQIQTLRDDLTKTRQEIQTLIEVGVEKSLGDKINMINGALTESILQKEVLIDKGLITRAEINAKYAALKRN